MLLLLVTTETRMVSETELSLAAKSANSAFPPTYIKAPFVLKRAAQGMLLSCRSWEAKQGWMQQHLDVGVGGMLFRSGMAHPHLRGGQGSRQTARPLESDVGVWRQVWKEEEWGQAAVIQEVGESSDSKSFLLQRSRRQTPTLPVYPLSVLGSQCTLLRAWCLFPGALRGSSGQNENIIHCLPKCCLNAECAVFKNARRINLAKRRNTWEAEWEAVQAELSSIKCIC